MLIYVMPIHTFPRDSLHPSCAGGVGAAQSWSSQTAPYSTGGGNPVGASMSTAGVYVLLLLVSINPYTAKYIIVIPLRTPHSPPSGAVPLLSRTYSSATDVASPGAYLENSVDDNPHTWKGKAVRLPTALDDRDGAFCG